ncbi:MAG: DUF2066 domain-containing protein, partial [Steroidobacteraceae bacterium]
RYVRSSQPAASGMLEVSFDGPAIERQIIAADRSVWDARRPFILVVMDPPPTGAEQDAMRQSLEQIAAIRGLPVTLVPMPTTDADGRPLTDEALLTDAQRLGGNAVLLGRAPGVAAPPSGTPGTNGNGAAGSGGSPSGASAPAQGAVSGPGGGSAAQSTAPAPSTAQAAVSGTTPSATGAPAPSSGGTAPAPAQAPGADVASATWQWTLLTGFSTDNWSGTFAEGINGAADALARVQGSSLPLADEEARIEVSGIDTLADYATVERMLASLPGVQRSGLEQADGLTATFDVLIRGGGQAVEQALAHSRRLVRQTGQSAQPRASASASPVPGALDYRFQP